MGGEPVETGKQLFVMSGSIRPTVTILDDSGKHLITVNVTKCDQCCRSLIDKHGGFKWRSVRILDDAVRPLYFCSDKCKARMEDFKAKYGHFPDEKLNVKSVR